MVKIRIRKNLRLTADESVGLLFVLYLCMELLNAAFRTLLGVIGLSDLAMIACFICVYVPLLFLCIKSTKYIQKEFILLFAFLCVFFLVTYIIHPDYEYWYTRSYWGVWDYVLRPDNGLYIFLFLMLLKDPRKILKYLKMASVLMILFYAYRLIPFIRNGYWLRQSADGTITKSSYNLEYGYDVLLYELTFMYCALKERKLFDCIFAGLGLVCLVLGGSRGPFLCMTVFLLLYFGTTISRSRRKIVYILLTAIIGVTLYAAYQYLLGYLIILLKRFGLSSRIIKTLIMGTVSDDNGRFTFWNTTIDMIKKNPFGYGAMGTRHVLYALHEAGYPHNFFLELIADLGVFVGGGLSIFFIWRAIAIIRMKNNEDWKGVFMIFVGMFFNLMISSTFYHRTGFWGLLAVGICIYQQRKQVRKKNSFQQIG